MPYEPTTPQKIAQQILDFYDWDESKWCQNQYAHDKDGRSVEPQSPDAVRFCPVGAAIRLGLNSQVLYNIIPVAITGGEGWTSFNDNHTFPEVMAALRAVTRLGVAQ